MKNDQEKRPLSIKLSTLLQAALFACLGGYIGAEYQSLRNAADMQVLQEAGYVNKAKSVPIAEFTDVPYNETAEYKQLKQHMKGRL